MQCFFANKRQSFHEFFSAKKKVVFATSLVFFYSVLIYSHTARFELVWDDIGVINYNRNIRSVKLALKTFYTSNVRGYFKYDPSSLTSTNYRPMRTLLHSLIYKFWMLNPFPYHIANVLLFACVSTLLFLLLVRLIKDLTVALAGAFLYCTHPLNTEVVCWAKSAEDLLATFFLLLCFHSILFIDENKNRRLFSMVLCCMFPLALLSKLSTVCFPLFLVFYWFFRTLNGERSFLEIPEIIKKNSLKVILLSILFLQVICGLSMRYLLIGQLSQGGFITGERWTTYLSMPRVFLRYLRLELCPIGLLADYQAYPRIESIVDITGWLYTGFFLLILTTLTIVLSKSRTIFGWFWFWCFLLPFTNLVPMVQLGAERFLFIPTIGIIWMVTEGAVAYNKTRLFTLCSLPVIVVFSILSFQRSFTWQNELSLWKTTIAQVPDCKRVKKNLIKAYLSRGKPFNALPYAQELVNECPDPENESLLGLILCVIGKDKAGLPLLVKNKNDVVLNIVGVKAIRQNKLKLAEKCFILAISFAPDNPKYRFNLSKLKYTIDKSKNEKTKKIRK